jgi:hypothetical protein
LRPEQLRAAIVVAGLAVAAGCSKGGGEERYVPAESNAREALTAALTKWKNGEPISGQVPVGKVKVQVLDQAWTNGVKLQEYDIVGEEPPAGAGPRVFSVRLKTAKGEQTARYYVFGIDPLWVCDEAGYKKMSGS